MTLEEFYKDIENEPLENKIVLLRYKHPDENNWTHSKELLVIDIGGDKYTWFGDWNDGEVDVVVLAFINVTDVEIPPEQMHGEWTEKSIHFEEEGNAKVIDAWQSAKCSVCGCYYTTPYLYYFSNYNYCPVCGSDMRKV